MGRPAESTRRSLIVWMNCGSFNFATGCRESASYRNIVRNPLEVTFEKVDTT
jgi:hypothetical protein